MGEILTMSNPTTPCGGWRDWPSFAALRSALRFASGRPLRGRAPSALASPAAFPFQETGPSGPRTRWRP